jgi:Collagen triple helix repeat (20 copies)
MDKTDVATRPPAAIDSVPTPQPKSDQTPAAGLTSGIKMNASTGSSGTTGTTGATGTTGSTGSTGTTGTTGTTGSTGTTGTTGDAPHQSTTGVFRPLNFTCPTIPLSPAPEPPAPRPWWQTAGSVPFPSAEASLSGLGTTALSSVVVILLVFVVFSVVRRRWRPFCTPKTFLENRWAPSWEDEQVKTCRFILLLVAKRACRWLTLSSFAALF